MPRKKPVPLMLRLPSDLHKRLAREADKAGRSLNQELVRRLEDSFRLRPEAIEDLTELLGGLTERHRALLEQLDLTLGGCGNEKFVFAPTGRKK
jgi:hypothetical protein